MSVLVTLHNVVSIPPAACQGGRIFRVEVRAGSASASVVGTFSSADAVESSPGFFEVRLDESSRGTGAPSGVWLCGALLEATVTVWEAAADPSAPTSSPSVPAESGRVVATSAPLSIDVADLIENRKLITVVTGTEFGQVGVSFTVDPADLAGYRSRLEAFLKRYNPQGMHLIDSVVEVVPELDTFTKLYKKYKLQDYGRRLREFLTVYGPEYIPDVPSLLEQWEGREEALMRNLILDNGPEPRDIDVDQRVDAFLATHQLRKGHPAVISVLAAYRKNGDGAALFAKLTSRFGPEPDPRTYLFPAPQYPPPREVPTSSPQPASHRAPTEGDQLHLGQPSRPPPPRPSSSLAAASESAAEQDIHDYVKADERGGGGGPAAAAMRQSETRRSVTTTGAITHSTSEGYYDDQLFTSGAQPPVGAPVPAPQRQQLTQTPRSKEALWPQLCASLPARAGLHVWRRECDLFYGTPEEFRQQVAALGIVGSHEEQEGLVAERERRVGQALTEEHLRPEDTRYDAAVAEAAALAGLHSLHLQVIGVTAFFHREHYAGFSTCLESAHEARTQRAVLVGERSALMEAVRYGRYSFSPMAVSSSSTDSAAAPPCAVFLSEPFRHCHTRRPACMLVCEVVTGRACTKGGSGSSASTATAPQEAAPHFLSHYDSCTFVDRSGGPALAVYRPQQVLPRLLVQCTVDPTLMACPSHPERAAEYYVVESHAFACSHCVVLGAFKGKEAVTLEAAAIQARSRLAEIQRTAEALGESLGAFDQQLRHEQELIPTAPRRMTAVREVERLRREVEQRIHAIMEQVDRADAEQLARIEADKAEVEATRTGVADLVGSIAAAASGSSTAAQAVTELQRVHQGRRLEQLLARARDRLPTAALEKVLPLEDVAPRSPRRQASATSPRNARMGLNESRFDRASGESGTPAHAVGPQRFLQPQRRVHLSTSPQSRGSGVGHLRAGGEPEGDDTDELYAKYVAAMSSSVKATKDRARSPVTDSPPPAGAGEYELRGRTRGPHSPSAASTSATGYTEGVGDDTGPEQVAKQWLTHGWALIRDGDLDGARAAWERVYGAFEGMPLHTVAQDILSAKARAYIAEAIEKDYPGAARWYTRCLQLDPEDCMTAYNYGVLLEALLGRPEDALALYDRAADLGDAVAARRAKQLRDRLHE